MTYAQLAQVEGLAPRQPVMIVFEDLHRPKPKSFRIWRPEFTLPWVGRLNGAWKATISLL
jgi:hypothetical protein